MKKRAERGKLARRILNDVECWLYVVEDATMVASIFSYDMMGHWEFFTLRYILSLVVTPYPLMGKADIYSSSMLLYNLWLQLMC